MDSRLKNPKHCASGRERESSSEDLDSVVPGCSGSGVGEGGMRRELVEILIRRE